MLRELSRSDVLMVGVQDEIIDFLGDVPTEVFDSRCESIYLLPLIRMEFHRIQSGFAFTIEHDFSLSFLESSRNKSTLTKTDNNRALYSA